MSSQAIVVVVSYLIGSVSFAVIVSHLMGLSDPRTYGSGNPGATNVLRSGNKKAAVLTLIGDAFKGWFAVWLVRTVAPHFGADAATLETDIALAGLAVFIGHLFPIFFRFKGGKGVATAAGVLLAFNPLLGLATLATWLVVAFVFRYSSLAALVASLVAPFFNVMMFGANRITPAIAAMSVMLIWRHRKNIGNLFAGKESKLGAKKTEPS